MIEGDCVARTACNEILEKPLDRPRRRLAENFVLREWLGLANALQDGDFSPLDQPT